jgi:hypothetical protein
VPLESFDRGWIERGPSVEQGTNLLGGPGLEWQHDDQRVLLLRPELELGQALGDLSDEAGLCHGRDGDGLATSSLKNDGGATVESLRRRAANVHAGESLVRDVAHAVAPFEAQAERQELELPGDNRPLALAPDDSVALLHAPIFRARGAGASGRSPIAAAEKPQPAP